MNDGAYLRNLDEYKSKVTHCIILFVNAKSVTYLDSFGVAGIPEEIKGFICNKNIIIDTFRIQAYDSIMCGFFCIELIDFMLGGKTLTDYTNLFLSYNFKMNDELILVF